MGKHIRGLMLLVMVLAIGASLLLQAQNRKPGKPLMPTQLRDKLHEMAQKSGGHYVLRYRPNRSTVHPNLEELAKRSDLVIVGRTLTHRSKLSEDGNFITQDFLVRVQEVVKGDLAKARSVVISLPGGSQRFADRTYATVEPLGSQPAQNGETYVFFLKSPPKGSAIKEHRLASETQGMYALTSGKVAPSHLAADDPLAGKYRQMGAADFLRQVHKAVPRSEVKEVKKG